MRTKLIRVVGVAAAVSLACASPALAHAGHSGHAPDGVSAFLAGLAHPLTGLDHMAAALGLGLWAGALGGKATYRLPAAFLLAMALGAFVAASGARTGVAEPAILASAVALLGLAGLRWRAPALLGAGLAAAFGLPHGYAHVAEAADGSLLAYGAGVGVSTLGVVMAAVAVGARALARTAARSA